MKVFTQVPRDWGATIYYRVIVPFRSIEKTCPDFGGMLETEGTSNPQRVAEAISHSDLVLSYQPISDHYLEMISKVKRFMTTRRPAFILDTDDNLFEVNAYNHAFATLGIKRPDGTPLRTGDSMVVEMESGAKRPLYVDRQGDFNIVENWFRMEVYRAGLKSVDLVTCSTPPVEAVVHRESHNMNTFIAPNHILFEDFPQIELGSHPGEVRILWQGSPTHILDLFNIRDSVIKLAKKYPHTKWVFWGHDYPPIGEALGAQYQYIPWCEYNMFKLRLSTINHDIAIAPLAANNYFEECRSAIKWYESSSIARPAPVLAERTGAFKEEMEDGVTGSLYTSMDEFEQKLSALIEDTTLRTTLASNAADWVHENRDALKWAPTLWERWKSAAASANTKEGLNGTPPEQPQLQPV